MSTTDKLSQYDRKDAERSLAHVINAIVGGSDEAVHARLEPWVAYTFGDDIKDTDDVTYLITKALVALREAERQRCTAAHRHADLLTAMVVELAFDDWLRGFKVKGDRYNAERAATTAINDLLRDRARALQAE